MLLDSHCHLDYFTPLELPLVLERAHAAGVAEMVTIGTTSRISALVYFAACALLPTGVTTKGTRSVATEAPTVGAGGAV